MTIVRPEKLDTGGGFPGEVDPNADDLTANGYYVQNATSNDTTTGIERGTDDSLQLLAGSYYTTTPRKLEDNLFFIDPTEVGNTSTPTYNADGTVASESCTITAGGALIRTISYTYNADRTI